MEGQLGLPALTNATLMIPLCGWEKHTHTTHFGISPQRLENVLSFIMMLDAFCTFEVLDSINTLVTKIIKYFKLDDVAYVLDI